MLDLPDLFSIEIRSAHNQKLVCVLIFYMEQGFAKRLISLIKDVPFQKSVTL